ncbi:reverse transcriptase [Phytophthora megakarya]|uniref:Reverse transcriptase n=1 Tax=Phytophthora megakarya TaxID=4795 RepID=A0A225WT58_9STRA|nr:reverse transcriptase [Phytophthora megakarya]
MPTVVGLRGEACVSKSVGSTIGTGYHRDDREACNSRTLLVQHRVFVEELLVLDLDDKFDMVLAMPWLTGDDPIIDWEKRTALRFGHRGATEAMPLLAQRMYH